MLFLFPSGRSVEYFAARIPGTELDEQTATILEFLEQEEHTVISAVHNKSDGKIKFQHRIPNDEVCLLFYKVPQVGQGGGSGGSGGTGEPLLGILTLEGGLVKSIYNSVSRVFSPHATARVSCMCIVGIQIQIRLCIHT